MELIDWDNKNWKDKENGDFIFDLANITAKTFDTTAEKWALVIANTDKGVEKHQLRNFYDKVLELHEKAINADDKEFQTKVLPFVKMLNSKVAYAKNKQTSPVNQAFVNFMTEAIAQVVSVMTFTNFKYLFEAILGFYQKEEIKKFQGKTDCKKSVFFIKQNYERNCGGKR